METKVCKICEEEKELSEFKLTQTAKRKGTSERMSYCIVCFRIVKNERLRTWRRNNPEKIKEERRQSYIKNREYELQFHKEYVEKNKDKIVEYNKKFRKENRDILNQKRVKRFNEDKIYRLSTVIRNSIRSSFIKFGYTKKSKTYRILGISYEEFKTYLESRFESWMTWDNHGSYNGELNCGWDIDHIIPISSATSEEELYKLNHYTNFQPLCSKVNRDIKKGKFIW